MRISLPALLLVVSLPAFISSLQACGGSTEEDGLATTGGAGTSSGGSSAGGSSPGGANSGGSTGGSSAGGSPAGAGQGDAGFGVAGEGGGGEAGAGEAGAAGEGGAGGEAGGLPEDPFAVEPTCTSGTQWKGKKGPAMNPGEACNKCHSSQVFDKPPIFSVAGTVYPTAHEPNNCVGLNGTQLPDLRVVITDANGKVTELKVGSTGNFSQVIPGFAKPYTAKVVSDAGERVMVTPQDNGDCNSCHTQKGTDKAPGRIIPPLFTPP